MSVVQVLLLLVGPALAGVVGTRTKVGRWLGPVVVAYLFGMVLANLPLGLSPERRQEATDLSETVAAASLMLAIPLLLVGTQVRALLKVAPRMLSSFLFACIAATVSSVGVCLLVERILPNARQIAAMLVGVYVGGTANMAALRLALDVPADRYMALNAADVVAGGVYLFLLMAFGPRAARFLLRAPEFTGGVGARDEVNVEAATDAPTHLQRALSLLLGVVLAGLSVGAVVFVRGKPDYVPILLMLTTLGLGCAMIPKLHSLPGTAEVGDYCLLIFCVATGTLVSAQKVAESGVALVALCSVVMLLTVSVHTLLARLFKIDAGTLLITSTATIFGPPFVPAVARAMRNDALVAPGVTIGLLGLAAGTYLGLATAWALGL